MTFRDSAFRATNENPARLEPDGAYVDQPGRGL